MSNVAIRVEGLGKQYRIGGHVEKYKTFRDTISGLAAAPARRIKDIVRGRAPTSGRNDTVIWALRDLSFTVEHGEVLGIIGHNGAGKSTLLKVLSRITEPTEGQAVVYGRLGALLEVGTGFHPELTGRENIFLNAAILGMSRREIEKFIDTPVKQYSSGMALRLGFSVAAHLEPEILVVDEVLAVGDLAFQRKCLGKMGEVSRQGRTVLFVSHNMAAITNLTQRSILLSRGSIIFDGDTGDAITTYMQTSQSEEAGQRQVLDLRLKDGLTLSAFLLRDKRGEEISVLQCGDSLHLTIKYVLDQPVLARFLIAFVNMNGTRAFTITNRHVSGEDFHLKRDGAVTCVIDSLQLVPGRYFIRLAVFSGRKMVYENNQMASIDIIGSDVFGSGVAPSSRDGVYVQPSRWEVVEASTVPD